MLKKITTLRVFLTDTLIVVFLLGAFELYLRKYNPDWSIAPTTNQLTRGYPVVKNSLGLRNPEISSDKNQDVFRILVLGNSTTFGTGVSEEMTYISHLQDLLNSETSKYSFEIINGGGQGGDILTMIDFFKNKAEILKPDLVILAFSPSMIAKSLRSETNIPLASQGNVNKSSLKKQFRLTALKLHQLLYSTYIYATFDTNFRKRLYTLGVIEDNLNKPVGATFAYAFDEKNIDIEEVMGGYSRFASQLSLLRAEVVKKGLPFQIVNIPSQFELSTNQKDNIRNYPLEKIRISPSEEINKIANIQGLNVIDSLPIMKASRQQMLKDKIPYESFYIPHDYTHLNNAGNRLIARTIYEALLEKNIFQIDTNL